MRESRQLALTAPAALCLFILALAGCGKGVELGPVAAPPAASEARPAAILNDTDPGWIKQSSPHSKTAVVLVHGLFGDTLGTWTLPGKTPLYDYVLQHQPIARSADFFAFGFSSNMLRPGSLDVREASNKLDASLQFSGVYDYKHIVFVAHSMGGLVVMRHLIANPDLIARVPLVVLYSTPQEGAQIAAIADKVARNGALSQMFPANRNVYLQQLDDDWKSLPRKPVVVCGYEKLPTYGAVIVPWDSATRFCSERAQAMEESNHLTIVKPDRPSHPSVVLLVNALTRHVLPKLEGRLDMPDFVAEGQERVFRLTGAMGQARLVNASQARVRYTVGEPQTPGLYVGPETPRDIDGDSTVRLQLVLTASAREQEYRFRLTTDIPSETIVVVKAPDIATLRIARATQRNKALAAVGDYLDRPDVTRELASLPAEGRNAHEAIAKATMDALFKEEAGLSESAKWLLTADVLAGISPEVGAVALRQSERVSPRIASTPTARQLAGYIAQHTGERQVFASAVTPRVAGRPSTPELARNPEETNLGLATAAKMKAIPQLRASGLALEGDAHRARGDLPAAREAYRRASELKTSPALSERIRVLERPERRPITVQPNR